MKKLRREIPTVYIHLKTWSFIEKKKLHISITCTIIAIDKKIMYNYFEIIRSTSIYVFFSSCLYLNHNSAA